MSENSKLLEILLLSIQRLHNRKQKDNNTQGICFAGKCEFIEFKCQIMGKMYLVTFLLVKSFCIAYLWYDSKGLPPLLQSN